MIDVIFIAKNRLEFTKASFNSLAANTDWDLVRTLWVYDDGSTDGTREWLDNACVNIHRTYILNIHQVYTDLGSPAAIMREFALRGDVASQFAKVDNDVVVPPGWLNACDFVMGKCPELDLLGIEHPYSRTPRLEGGPIPPRPELTAHPGTVYSPCNSIGGIGLMRTNVFRRFNGLIPHSTYGGFTEFQIGNPGMVKGWITPPLNVILLDRLPAEPWLSLSHVYISKGWQRPWSGYDTAHPFWEWWTSELITASV